MLDRRIPWWSVSAGQVGHVDLPWTWMSVLRDQEAGADPTRGWRESLATATARQYGTPPPAAMPAAFVLQWLLQVPATLGVYAAVAASRVLDPQTCDLSIATDARGHFPVEVQLRSAGPRVGAMALEQNHRAYLEAGHAMAASYRPGVQLGRRTRMAMVEDLWEDALARAGGGQPPARDSCCFIYTLPGALECAGCPRRRRRPTQ